MNFLRKPTLEELRERELYEARRSLLEAQTALEYARAIVEYNKARVARLEQA